MIAGMCLYTCGAFVGFGVSHPFAEGYYVLAALLTMVCGYVLY